MTTKVQLVIIVLAALIKFSTQDQSVIDHRRPIYNIAHMVNSVAEIELMLDKGANAIETDVTFDANGTQVWTYHGFPCDCFRVCDKRENMTTFLQHIKEITTPGSPNFRQELVFIFLDLKVTSLAPDIKAVAGKSLASLLVNTLWQGESKSQVHVLLSLQHPGDHQVVTAAQEVFNDQLNDSFIQRKIGWDVGMYHSISEVEEMWSQLNVSHNLWLGDGISNCFRHYLSNYRIMAVLLEFAGSPKFAKVYDWTIDPKVDLDGDLGLGVDAIITNHPETFLAEIQGPKFREIVRLATVEDNPWERFHTNATSLLKELPEENFLSRAMRIMNP